MPHHDKKPFIFHMLTAGALMVGLGACDMPMKPEGADVGGMTHIADQLHAQGDDSGAAEFYQRALQHNPNDTRARTALAQILETHGDTAAAAQQYQLALNAEPDSGELHRDLGRVDIKQGRYADAKDQYEKALQSDSGDDKALNGLGIALDYLGNHEAAQKTYKQVLDDKPDDLTALSNLGHSYVMVGAYSEAIALLEPHLHDKTATPALRQNLAEAYGMAGMDVDAERVAKMDLSPDQVRHNLEAYRARRAALSPEAKLYADLGSFPTEAMADARIEDVKANFADDAAGLIIATQPEVKTSGGTPSFTVRVSGFARAEKLRSFCEKLKKAELTCKAHN
jgi:Flp pilus assembly protein TadD